MLASSLGHALFGMLILSHQTTFCDALGPFIYAAPPPLLTFLLHRHFAYFPPDPSTFFPGDWRGIKGVRYLGVVGLY